MTKLFVMDKKTKGAKPKTKRKRFHVSVPVACYDLVVYISDLQIKAFCDKNNERYKPFKPHLPKEGKETIDYYRHIPVSEYESLKAGINKVINDYKKK